MPEYPIPQSVLRNAEQRLAVVANYTRRPCRRPGCDQPATHWPATSVPACEDCRIRLPTPVPDPTRTLYALRDRAIAERLITEEEQLLTVRINYTWHPDWPQPYTPRRAA